METVYTKNLDAIKEIDIELYDELSKIEENIRYEVFQGKDREDINIVDMDKNIKFYNNPIQDIQEKINYFEKFSEYDFLYIYGIGSGIEIINLLKNKKHQQIVIIEPNIELLFIALNLYDFYDNIVSGRLVLIPVEKFIFSTAIKLFTYKNARFYARVFKLHPINSYYEYIYPDDMVRINGVFIRAWEYYTLVAGNSTVDQVLGLKQHLSNIPLMLKGAKFSSLRTKRNSNIAVIVATGPSLHKQLKLLKEIEDYVTIISVDASMPILEKNDIKPDFVVSMERDEESDVFHKKTSKKFQENINFICASLQNKNVFKAIKNGTTMLVMRPLPYNSFFKLHDYGYVCSGMSSANMAHELAIHMGFEKAVFIGQDLAYGKDGASHSKDHVLGEDFIKNGKMNTTVPRKYEMIELEAYGGKGTVKSIYPWKLFLNGLVYSVETAKDIMLSINSTEGGARIDGTIEMPFKEVIEQYVDKSKKKDKIILDNTSEKEVVKQKRKCDKRVKKLIKEGEKLQKRIEKTFLTISEQLKRIENKKIEEVVKVFNMMEMIEMLDLVNNLREELSSNDIFNDFYHDMLQSVLVNYELELAEVKVSKVTSRDENELKAIKWINLHRVWMFDLAGGIWNILEILKNDYTAEIVEGL